MGRPPPNRSVPDARPRVKRAAPPDRDELIRRLIASAPCDKTALHGRAVVVLDVRVDSYRCVLIRQPDTVAVESIELSPREREIARLVAKGLPNKVIARLLEISTWTVGTYLRRIFAKLAVSSRAAMVAKLAEIRNRNSEGFAS